MKIMILQIKRKRKSSEIKKMNRLIIISSLYIIIVLGCSLTSFSQQRLISDDWVINVPSSPLVAELGRGGEGISITNPSDHTVKSFSFGCIKTNGKSYYTIAEGRKFNNEIKSATPTLTSFILMDTYELKKNERQLCLSKKSKMGIVEVVFEDGGRWILPSVTEMLN